jgi:hypothetical protein
MCDEVRKDAEATRGFNQVTAEQAAQNQSRMFRGGGTPLGGPLTESAGPDRLSPGEAYVRAKMMGQANSEGLRSRVEREMHTAASRTVELETFLGQLTPEVEKALYVFQQAVRLGYIDIQELIEASHRNRRQRGMGDAARELFR